jgi:hypothetical protein
VTTRTPPSGCSAGSAKTIVPVGSTESMRLRIASRRRPNSAAPPRARRGRGRRVVIVIRKPVDGQCPAVEEEGRRRSTDPEAAVVESMGVRGRPRMGWNSIQKARRERSGRGRLPARKGGQWPWGSVRSNGDGGDEAGGELLGRKFH